MKDAAPASAGEIFRLTIPQLGLMLCHLCISMTDIWVAGQLDSRVLASMGFITQVSAMLMLIISIVGSGCMATVSQSLGAGLPLRAARYAGLIVGISFLTGCIVSIMGLAVLPLILQWGLVAEEIMAIVTVFAVVYALQIPFYYSMIMLNSVFRAHKLVWLPFATLVLVTVVNFTGSVGLGLGRWGLPDCGYAAVAWATFFSALLGFVCNLVLGLRKGILHRYSLGPWRWNRVAAPRLWRIGAPAALGNLAAQTGNVALLSLTANLAQGAIPAVAGITLGTRIMGFILFPLGALGMTVTILVGHLLGGRQPDAACVLGRRCALWSALVMAAAAVCIALLREPAAALFNDDTATIMQAGQFLLFACWVLPLQAAGQMLTAVLAGAGSTRFICIIGCASTWGVALPVAWALSRFTDWGAGGIYAGMALGNLCAALWTVRVFKQRRWLRG